jgi:sugar phosphate isomerase/epimerase
MFSVAAAAAAGPATAPQGGPAVHVAHAGLLKLGWQLAVPTGTFADRTVFEAIDLLHGLTVHHLELTPGQPLSADELGVTIGADLSAARVAKLLAKLKGAHMDVVSYGPVDVGAGEATARAVFAFAKAVHAKVLVIDLPVSSMGRLDRLATEYQVNVALPNGPATTAYRAATDLLNATAGCSRRVGSGDCLGGWREAGADPAAATRALRDHIVEVRVDDGDVRGTPMPAVAPLAELGRQGFRGVVVMASQPGLGTDVIDRFVASANGLSDAVTAVAAAEPTAGK